MGSITRRLSALSHLTWPLTLTFIGVVLLSLGVAYLFIHAYRSIEGLPAIFYQLTLQFLPRPLRGLLLIGAGLLVLAIGVWRLSGLVVIPIGSTTRSPDGELVLGYRRESGRPRVVLISGGAGMLVLAGMGEQVERLTCIVPVQDPVEYYYRAAGLFNFQNVYYVVPTPEPLMVAAVLDDGSRRDVRHLAHDPAIAERHVARLSLERPEAAATPIARVVREAIAQADAIVLGPGSLFESILPSLLLDELRQAIAQSPARKIFICNLMTEPGRTTGFGVADHIRAIRQYGGLTPDIVLLSVQRIDTEIQQLYAAANQRPVRLDPDEYEETAVLPGEQVASRHVVVEGSPVVEADLASSVIQYTASLDNPTQSRAVRVLRHDGQKLTAAILELIRRS